MNMFKAVNPTTVEEYLAAVPEERKELIDFLDRFIRKTVPKMKRHFAYNMIGYGSFQYLNYKKETIEWPVIALANQKNYVSLYVCSIDAGEYIAEKHKDSLGKVNVGKSCIRFKKKEDLNLELLGKILKFAAQNPGLEGIGKSKKK